MLRLDLPAGAGRAGGVAVASSRRHHHAPPHSHPHAHRTGPLRARLVHPPNGGESGFVLAGGVADGELLDMGDRRVVGPSGPLIHDGDLITQQPIDAQLLLRQKDLLRLRRLVPVEGVVEPLLVGGIPLHEGRGATVRHPGGSPPRRAHPIHHHRHPAGRAGGLPLTPAFGELRVGIAHRDIGAHPLRELLHEVSNGRLVALEELPLELPPGLEIGEPLEEVGAELGGPRLELRLAVPEALPLGERLALHARGALVDVVGPTVVGMGGFPFDLLERRDLAVDLGSLRGDLRRQFVVGHEQRRQDECRHQRREEPEVVLRYEVPIRADGIRDHGHGFSPCARVSRDQSDGNGLPDINSRPCHPPRRPASASPEQPAAR